MVAELGDWCNNISLTYNMWFYEFWTLLNVHHEFDRIVPLHSSSSQNSVQINTVDMST
mgnify:CR=1 FL=1